MQSFTETSHSKLQTAEASAFRNLTVVWNGKVFVGAMLRRVTTKASARL
jgi:hypothetical protein